MAYRKNNGRRELTSARDKLTLYSHDFSVIRDINLPMMYSGYIVSTVPNAIKYNKRQGLALGTNFFVASYGGFYSPKMKNTMNTYQGIRVFDFYGKVLMERMFEPNGFIKNLKKLGLPVSRIENEGVAVKDDDIYSMYIYSDRNHKKFSYDEGILILKERMK